MILPALASCSFAAIATYITRGTIGSRSQLWGDVVWHGPREHSAIALTFDDGPTPGGTDAILDILQSAGVAATFFVIGQNVERYPQLLSRIHEAGHAIGNHTWHHDHQGWLGSRRYWENEIRRTDELIEKTIGVRPVLFRPPMGIKTFLTLAAARRLGHITANWSLRGRDGVATDAKMILGRLSSVDRGDIVLLHDGTSPNYPHDPTATISALPRFLEKLRLRELKAVRLDALLNFPIARYTGSGN
jgi:peptidoglycan/xylan/chitin deacetylase (PgdA/CDA1 family)